MFKIAGGIIIAYLVLCVAPTAIVLFFVVIAKVALRVCRLIKDFFVGLVELCQAIDSAARWVVLFAGRVISVLRRKPASPPEVPAPLIVVKAPPMPAEQAGVQITMTILSTNLGPRVS